MFWGVISFVNSCRPTRSPSNYVATRCYSTENSGKGGRLYQVRKIFRSYTLTRYVDYVKNYDRVFEKKFPRAMHVYRVFAVGIKDFYQDLKEFVQAKGMARTALKSGLEIHSLPRKKLDILYKMPQEMLRVAPVLLISALPFANYIVFPIA